MISSSITFELLLEKLFFSFLSLMGIGDLNLSQSQSYFNLLLF